MKTKFVLICMLFLSAGYVYHSVYGDVEKADLKSFLLSDVEALAEDPENSGEYINCFCSVTSDQVCSASGRGSKCHGGYGAKCWEYNANCAR